jgi:hypothetical protein
MGLRDYVAKIRKSNEVAQQLQAAASQIELAGASAADMPCSSDPLAQLPGGKIARGSSSIAWDRRFRGLESQSPAGGQECGAGSTGRAFKGSQNLQQQQQHKESGTAAILGSYLDDPDGVYGTARGRVQFSELWDGNPSPPSSGQTSDDAGASAGSGRAARRKQRGGVKPVAKRLAKHAKRVGAARRRDGWGGGKGAPGVIDEETEEEREGGVVEEGGMMGGRGPRRKRKARVKGAEAAAASSKKCRRGSDGGDSAEEEEDEQEEEEAGGGRGTGRGGQLMGVLDELLLVGTCMHVSLHAVAMCVFLQLIRFLAGQTARCRTTMGPISYYYCR